MQTGPPQKRRAGKPTELRRSQPRGRRTDSSRRRRAGEASHSCPLARSGSLLKFPHRSNVSPQTGMKSAEPTLEFCNLCVCWSSHYYLRLERKQPKCLGQLTLNYTWSFPSRRRIHWDLLWSKSFLLYKKTKRCQERYLFVSKLNFIFPFLLSKFPAWF